LTATNDFFNFKWEKAISAENYLFWLNIHIILVSRICYFWEVILHVICQK
jgi:hypothetical protein